MNQLIVDRPIQELARQIREMCGDDDQAFVDSLEGVSDTVDAARRVVRLLIETNAAEESMKGLSATYGARAKVHADRSERIRGALLNFLQEVGTKNLPLPEATLTVATGQPRLVGTPDIATLPLELTRTTREPSLTAIKAALVAGQKLPGLSLSNAMPVLKVRTK
jgi:hypothetical protein